MAMLRLTPANLEFAKRQLRHGYPEISSAHRTEAFAAACGYRTYAAQLADLGTNGKHPPVIRMDGQGWTRRLTELGYGKLRDDGLATCFGLHDLPDPCWVIFSAQDHAPRTRWFYRSKKDNLPYITIKVTGRSATLEWDCVSLDTAADRKIQDDRSGAIAKTFFDIFQRASTGSGARPYFFGSAFVGSIKGLRPDIAQTLADVFFLALYQATRPSGLVAA